jgi:hypothetical protein
MCQNAIDAGTVEKTVAELKKLNLEHPDNWARQAIVHGTGGEAKP